MHYHSPTSLATLASPPPIKLIGPAKRAWMILNDTLIYCIHLTIVKPLRASSGWSRYAVPQFRCRALHEVNTTLLPQPNGILRLSWMMKAVCVRDVINLQHKGEPDGPGIASSCGILKCSVVGPCDSMSPVESSEVSTKFKSFDIQSFASPILPKVWFGQSRRSLGHSGKLQSVWLPRARNGFLTTTSWDGWNVMKSSRNA